MPGFNFLRTKSFAIDLGNNNTLVSDGENVLMSQPSYIVLDETHHRVRAIGSDAYDMFEKTHHNLRPVKPLKGGVIADQDSASRMLSEMMAQAYGQKNFLEGYDSIISGVPYQTTDVERRALRTALDQFHARHTFLVFEPLAAALGMGLNIQEPVGKMIVDIGGGITEIVVISLSGIATSHSIKTAGDTMDEDIRHYFRQRYNMAIGVKTAERIKIGVGAVLENLDVTPEPMGVKGKDLMTGIPVERKISHAEVRGILERSISAIELGILKTLETCPPELASDIAAHGICITGGNALLRGLKERLERTTRLEIHIDPYPLLSVSRGVAAVLRNPKKVPGLLLQG